MRAGDQDSQGSGRRVPVPLSRFVGREEELAALTDLIRDPDARLISVTGPGGVGKTRLAIQAAVALEPSFGGRIAIIRLAEIQDPDDVLPAMARAIGADDRHRSSPAALIQMLADDRWLLVIDNFEHVLSAAGGVAEVLQLVPRTTAVVTTRARLQVAGEHVVPLAPLPVPPVDLQSPVDLERFAATRLFVDRAVAAGTRFSLTDATDAIAQICRRLDGLPLAIELAAARMAVMPPAALIEQLEAGATPFAVLRGGPRDAPSRLQTVESAIAWSYDLLRPVEQAFFRRLSVFVGGFTLAWAAAMIRGHEGGEAYPIDAGVDPRLHWWFHVGRDLSDTDGRRMDAPALPTLDLDPMDGIQALLDSSLLQTIPDSEPNQPRYQMLETIREFGASRLGASAEEEDAVRINHAALTLGFAELMREEMWNDPQATTANRIERELGNIGAVLRWAVRRGATEAELALRLPQSLWLFWQTRGYVTEGRSWLERALALDTGPAWDRATAQTVAGLFAWIQADLDRAETAIAEARAFWKTTDNKHFLAETTLFSGLIAWTRGDLPRLIFEVETALALFRAWEGRHGIGTCLILLAIVAHRSGEPDRALRLLDEALVTCDATKFGWGSASSRLYAAEIERERGKLQVAAARSIEALDRFWAEGDPWGTGASMSGIALLAAANGDVLLAARLLGSSAALRAQAAAFLPVIDPETFAEAERQVRNARGSELFDRAYAEGQASVPEPALRQARRFAGAVVSGKARPAPVDAWIGLTPRQRDVLCLVAQGATAREIGAKLYIDHRTVAFHRAKGLKELGFTRPEFLTRFGGDRVPSFCATSGGNRDSTEAGP